MTDEIGDAPGNDILSSRMRKIEERYRTLIDNVDVGICIAKMMFDENNRAVDYLILDGNAAYERHTGLFNTVGKWVSEFAPDLERHWFDIYGHVALTGESVQFENGAVPLGNRWFEVEAHRVGDPTDHEVAILFTDVTSRRAARENQKLVNQELAHRMKNFVAIVQSMVTQTLRRTKSISEAESAIGGRLQAFARAQDVLGEEILDGADIVDVVASAIAPHQTDTNRISVDGPSFELSARRALGLSLGIHELATNSVKYGALSKENGTVSINWMISDGSFRFEWTERGGPPVTLPSERGFGSRLIENVIGANFEGKGTLHFEPPGLRFVLTSDTA
jgi:two-component sensor histidine kinase